MSTEGNSVKPWILGGIPRVAALPWPGIAGAFLCISGRQREGERRVGDRWYPKGQEHDEQREKYGDREMRTEPAISFLFDAGNCCAEWDGSYGPIQLWWRAKEGWKPSDESEWTIGAKAHWLYPQAFGAGHWSQSAVSEAELPRHFNEGDFPTIFQVLKQWAEARNADYAEARA